MENEVMFSEYQTYIIYTSTMPGHFLAQYTKNENKQCYDKWVYEWLHNYHLPALKSKIYVILFFFVQFKQFHTKTSTNFTFSDLRAHCA